MSGTRLLARRLGQLDEAGLAALLRRRPDVLLGAPLRDLSELTRRLREPHSLVAALQRATLPALQVAEAAQALGDGCTRTQLAALLQGPRDDGSADRADVDLVVDDLVAQAVLAEAAGRLELPEALAQIFPRPLGLGPRLSAVLGARPVESLRRLEGKLGLPKQRNRADALAAVLAHLADPATVRALVATAPPVVSAFLVAAAADQVSPADDAPFDTERFLARRAVSQWAADFGLVIDGPYSYAPELAAEVALVLRGPDYRAPFTPRRPNTGVRPVDRDRVERDSAAAVTQFADHAVAVLDHVARSPVPRVKSGGIGVRELARLARATAVDERAARLVLELADVTGLLAHLGQVGGGVGTVGVSAEFGLWRALEPADRMVPLLSAWWGLGWNPTAERDADGRVLRVLEHLPDCAGCHAGRVVVLETMVDIDGAVDREPLARAALWQRPLVHLLAQDGDEPFVTMWRESETVGVLADGAVTELGRVLMAGDPATLRGHLAGLLPASADQARFGGDLTVYVVGSPSARVSALLDSAADRESSGGATTWRFGPASVRRALDDGATGDGLTTALADISTADLPQPLTYLIADVARRHGHLRLSPVTTCIRGDEALLREVAADRKLARLGMRLLAPTVLACDAPQPELLTALRAAGNLPVSEERSGTVVELSTRRGRDARDRAGAAVLPAPGRPRPRPPTVVPQSADPAVVARLLLRGESPGISTPQGSQSTARRSGEPAAERDPEPARDIAVDRRAPTERELSRLTGQLSADQIRQLAHAIDTHARVGIEYLSSSGRITNRVIDEPELDGGSLRAWCELRSDERIFSLGRIRSVTAVAP